MIGKYFLSQGEFIPVKILQIDFKAKDSLASPYQASIFGGDIKVILDNKKDLHLLSSMFRVTMKPLGTKASKYHPGTGLAVIQGNRESIIKRVWLYIGGVIVRETGF